MPSERRGSELSASGGAADSGEAASGQPTDPPAAVPDPIEGHPTDPSLRTASADALVDCGSGNSVRRGTTPPGAHPPRRSHPGPGPGGARSAGPSSRAWPGPTWSCGFVPTWVTVVVTDVAARSRSTR